MAIISVIAAILVICSAYAEAQYIPQYDPYYLHNEIAQYTYDLQKQIFASAISQADLALRGAARPTGIYYTNSRPSYFSSPDRYVYSTATRPGGSSSVFTGSRPNGVFASAAVSSSSSPSGGIFSSPGIGSNNRPSRPVSGFASAGPLPNGVFASAGTSTSGSNNVFTSNNNANRRPVLGNRPTISAGASASSTSG